jgi:sugar/nucleoside kinase (ribokinase family)
LVFSGSKLPQPGAEVFADGFVMTPGGTANRAVAAARLGARTALLGVLGCDMFGERVAQILADEPGLDLRWVQRSETAHTPLTVAVTDEHDRSFITYEEPGTEVPRTWPGTLPSVRVAHVGLASEPPGWVRQLRTAGTTVFGGVGWDATHTWSPAVLDRLAEVDVFVPNEVEACSYTGTTSAEDALDALVSRVRTVVVTRGRHGAVAADAETGERVDIPAVPVTVVDPTGAGDVFVAALMVATLHGWDLATRVRFASLAASLSVRSLGGAASAPRPVDIAEFLAATPLPDGVFQPISTWARSRLDLRE